MNRLELVEKIKYILGDFAVYTWIPMHENISENDSDYIHFHIIKRILYQEIEKKTFTISKLKYVYCIEYKIINNEPYIHILIRDTDTLLNMRNKFQIKLNQYIRRLERVEECLKTISEDLSLNDDLI